MHTTRFTSTDHRGVLNPPTPAMHPRQETRRGPLYPENAFRALRLPRQTPPARAGPLGATRTRRPQDIAKQLGVSRESAEKLLEAGAVLLDRGRPRPCTSFQGVLGSARFCWGQVR